MSLDWGFIQNVATNELTQDQDHAKIEVLFDQLIEYDLNGSEKIEQLRMLFECSKLVMRFKANQVDVAIEEIDELENIISRENVNRKNLKLNLHQNGDKQTEQQLIELKRVNELLRTQLNEKDVEYNQLEQTKSALEQTLKLNERQLVSYSQEIEQLKEELHIEKEQINNQLVDSNQQFEQLKDMNKKFYILLEEMKNMESANTQLGDKVVKLNDELNSATQQIQTATAEMQYMKNSLKNLQEMNDILINEKEDHMDQIKRLKSLTDNYELKSDENLDSNAKTIRELQEKIKFKDDELNNLRLQFASISEEQIEEKKNYFYKEVLKRDNHIKLLRNQLNQAINDIEAQTRVIENLIEKNIESIHKFDNSQTEKDDKNGQLLSNNQLISKLEDELRSKDKEMTVLYQRNTLYEQGVYGLSEALQEINNLLKSIKSKDNEIDKLIEELNAKNSQLSNAQDELDYLKEIMNADEDLKQKLSEESDVKNDKLKILKLQKEVIRLEAEKISLYEEVLSHKLSTNLNVINKISCVQNTEQFQKSNAFQELENENKELQLAMKEILIGLKESDSKSDVIIDCPSLERLCQFFESRSINSSLTNVIALKAELDILRGHNEELRMSNKRLRNDIFKIFENYSKHLYIDFVFKHQSEYRSKDVSKYKSNKELNFEEKSGEINNDIEYINQTLIEDDFFNSDLSEGEIVLESRSIAFDSSCSKKDQETQTTLEGLNLENTFESYHQEINESIHKATLSNESSDSNIENSLIISESNQTGKEINSNLDFNDDKIDKRLIDQIKNEKSMVDQMTQTDLCLNDLRNVNYLMQIDEIEEVLKNNSVDELKNLIKRKNSLEGKSMEKFLEPQDNESVLKSNEINKKDATSQTIIEEKQSASTEQEVKCNQCSLVRDLLIEFQDKLDRIDSSIIHREDLYTERIKVLEEENNRFRDEIERMIQIKNDSFNQKEKQTLKSTDLFEGEDNDNIKSDGSVKNEFHIDKSIELINTDKRNIDNRLSTIDKSNGEFINQRGLINILETIIKCLQARIEHKDEAIIHYQQLLAKTQEEHQKEIQNLMKNYKKVTQHSIKAIQSTSTINQEQLKTSLIKYNDKLNEFKIYHQKVLADQKKMLELQTCEMKRLKNENERLKSQAISNEELYKLRNENDHLNKLIEKNTKFIEKLKSTIKEERAHKLEQGCETKKQEPGKVIQLNKLKNEIENLYKLLISKDKQIKELLLGKYNLEKKIEILIQSNKDELKIKTDELEKMKSLVGKFEKEKNILKQKQENVIKGRNQLILKINKETQTDKMIDSEPDIHDPENPFVEKLKQLDQTIDTLKQQLKQYDKREKELITMLEQNKTKEDLRNVRPSKEFFVQSIKKNTFKIKKKNSCDF